MLSKEPRTRRDQATEAVAVGVMLVLIWLPGVPTFVPKSIAAICGVLLVVRGLMCDEAIDLALSWKRLYETKASH